jgi:hypothetical protein
MVLGLAAFLGVVPAAWAQEKTPHIGYVYPAGGQQGTTFQVTIGGQYLADTSRASIPAERVSLADTSRACFSGSGIQATVMEEIPSLRGGEPEKLRQKITELMKGKQDAETEKQIAEIQKKLARHMSMEFRRRTYPILGEIVRLQVTLAPDAEPGPRELRLETPGGLSNRLTFCVGRLPEFREQEPEIAATPRDARGPISSPLTPETHITLPAVVNGQIIPHDLDMFRSGSGRFTADVDRYRFEARKGQQLVVAASARELIPYLADAVPGWFQATLALYDAKGKELAYDDDYRFHPDPVLFYKIPEDGQYTIEITDAISRGRPDFVYRIAVGELPFITSIFPLGGQAGEQTTVELTGWNLPADKLTMDAQDKAPGIYPLSVRKGDMISNSVPFAVDTLPKCLEKEPNDSPQTAQPVTLPLIINGRMDRPGDRDVFRFAGRAGERITAEVTARRLDSPLDSVLKLTDVAGKRLAFNDDHEDKSDALNTHHADSLIDFTLPANGTYCLHLSDAQHDGGPEYAYRLRISSPRPDFALRVVPSCINAQPGRLIPITIFALRKDGFSGEIALSLKGAPEGFSLGGGLVPAGQDQVRVTLMVPSMPSAEPISLSVEGRATIGGQEVVRTAVPADDMTQAFAYKHLVPAKDLKVAVVENLNARRLAGRLPKNSDLAKALAARRATFQPTMTMTLLGQQPVKIPVGGTAQVRISAPGAFGQAEIHVELSDPPEGIAVDSVSRVDRGLTIVLHGDAQKAKPGLKGNLIANAFSKRTVTTQDGKTRNTRWLVGMLPAIPFEIVKP